MRSTYALTLTLSLLSLCPSAAQAQAALPAWDPQTTPWPMFGHDVRRTNRSPFRGPQSYSPGSTRNWSYRCRDQAVINLQPAIDSQGVYVGGWGVARRNAGDLPDRWVKFDGKYVGLRLGAQSTPARQEVFRPFDPEPVPAGYLLNGRPKLPRDVLQVGGNNDFHVSYFNGTIEGTALIDPDTGVHYVGRGDGRLHAIDARQGRVLWSFETFNPELPEDPDGGGEVVGGALMGPGRIIYFATFGAPAQDRPNDPLYETHAVYAVTPQGSLLWRYPRQRARLNNPLLAPPALSPDGRTLYVATWIGDASRKGKLIALDLTAPASAGDGRRHKWELELENSDRLFRPGIYTRQISVGPAGGIYLAGAQIQLGGSSPVVVAVTDAGDRGEVRWVCEPQGYPSRQGALTAGLALWETPNRGLVRIYASTTHLRVSNGEGGGLFLIDPANGNVNASFDPASAGGVGGMTAPVLGADQTVYVGVRGKHHLFSAGGFVDGRMLAVRLQNGRFQVRWNLRVDGLLDWAAPAIGANGGLYFGSSDRYSPLLQAFWFGLDQATPNRSPKVYGVFE